MRLANVKLLSFVFIGLIGCNRPSAEDAMKSCVKWGNQGISIRSYQYGLTSHTRECLYDKGNRQVVGYEKDAKSNQAARKKVKHFRY